MVCESCMPTAGYNPTESSSHLENLVGTFSDNLD